MLEKIRLDVKPLGQDTFTTSDIDLSKLPYPDGWYNYIYIHWDSPMGRPAIYVGKGKNYRVQIHCTDSPHASKNIQAAVRTYGIAAFDIKILSSTDSEKEAFAREKALIRKYKQHHYYLFNGTEGGEGTTGYRHTDETKELLSKKSKAWHI